MQQNLDKHLGENCLTFSLYQFWAKPRDIYLKLEKPNVLILLVSTFGTSLRLLVLNLFPRSIYKCKRVLVCNNYGWGTGYCYSNLVGQDQGY